MNHGSIWCRRRAEAVSGGRKTPVFAVKINDWAIFAANDSKVDKNR